MRYTVRNFVLRHAASGAITHDFGTYMFIKSNVLLNFYTSKTRKFATNM